MEIFAHLLQNKLRTILTGLSVSMGIFLLIFLLGAGNGLIHAFRHNIGQFATDLVRVVPGFTSIPHEGWEEGRTIRLDMGDLSLVQNAAPRHITNAVADLNIGNVTVSHQNGFSSAPLVGVYPQQADLERIQLLAGRFINDIDIENTRKTIVLSQTLAEELFDKAPKAIGQQVRVDSLSYLVVGVRSAQGDLTRGSCYIPFTTAQVAYQKSPYCSALSLRTQGLTDPESNDAFSAMLRRSMARRHDFSPNDRSALYVSNPVRGSKEFETGISMLNTALWFIGLLTLLSGVVSISNIMLITVRERTHEFGIRKALGAHPWSILRSVLLESVLITTFFGYFGLVAGVVATEWLNRVNGENVLNLGDTKVYTFLNPTVDLHIALTALFVLIVAGLVAGFLPARKAVLVKPIEALTAK